MNTIPENLDTLESVLRAFIRAAGGFGEPVSIAAKCAAKAAKLWHDGEQDRLAVQAPAMVAAIKKARRHPALRTRAQLDEAIHGFENETHAARRGDATAQSVASALHGDAQALHGDAQAPSCASRMFKCHATADARFLARDHAHALSLFTESILLYVTDAQVALVTPEKLEP